MSPWRAAIDQALLLQKQPSLAIAFRSAALPDGMAVLIRLASDEGGRRKDLAQLLELDESILQSAASNYLLSICLYPDSDDLRALCLNPSADLNTAKEHHRLLLKWLHPDRNPDNQAYARRVNQAWSALKMQAKVNAVAGISAGARDVPEVQSSGRFPLFLWGLVGLVALLLALSMMPDADIYGVDAGTDEQVNAEDRSVDTPGSNFEKRLRDMKLSFGEMKKAVLPAVKLEKLQAKPINEQKIQAKQSQTLKLLELKPEIEPSVTVSEPVLVDEQPAKPIKSLPAVIQAKTISQPTFTVSHAQASKAPVEVQRDLQVEGKALLAEFRQRYKNGDIVAFMQMFSESARNNRGDRQAIESDYAQFFTNSSSRKISFFDEKWLFREGVIQFRANYVTSVRRKGELFPGSSKGSVEIVLSEENGKLRIQQILIGN